MLTYTVRPMYRYYRENVGGLSALSRAPEGFLTVVRDGDRVVHQFPRFESSKLCHSLAQRHILNIKAEEAAKQAIIKAMS